MQFVRIQILPLFHFSYFQNNHVNCEINDVCDVNNCLYILEILAVVGRFVRKYLQASDLL